MAAMMRAYLAVESRLLVLVVALAMVRRGGEH